MCRKGSNSSSVFNVRRVSVNTYTEDLQFFIHRRIVAEYEKTIAQMIGEPKHTHFILNQLFLFPKFWPFILHLIHLQTELRCEVPVRPDSGPLSYLNDMNESWCQWKGTALSFADSCPASLDSLNFTAGSHSALLLLSPTSTFPPLNIPDNLIFLFFFFFFLLQSTFYFLLSLKHCRTQEQSASANA